MRRGRVPSTAALALVLAVAAPRALAAAGAPADTLPAWLAAVAQGPLARAHWGVAVYDLTGDRWVVRHEANRYFVPASNLKLVVSAVALERLGPEYRWRTSVYGTAQLGADGALAGDLVLYGRGDPNLSGRFLDGGPTAVLRALADSLAARGLRRVTGDLVADESHWGGDPLHGDWTTYDVLWWYAAPVGALGFNDNAIDFRVRPAARTGLPPIVEGAPVSAFWSLDNRAATGPPGARSTFDLSRVPGTNRVIAHGVLPLDAPPRTEWFAVVDPAGWAGTVFRETLEERGIAIDGAVRSIADRAVSPVAAGDTVPLAAWTSPPLARVVETVNGRSQNWHAEQVLRTIAKEARGEGSWEAGLAVERETLAAMGVDTTAFLLRDASGLSNANLATPEALVELLRLVRRNPWGEAWAESLPVAAESGTLRRRFAGTAAAGRVRAKTGWVDHVHALSGYMTTVSGREYAFSVIVNQAGASRRAEEAIDRLVEALVTGAAP